MLPYIAIGFALASIACAAVSVYFARKSMRLAEEARRRYGPPRP